MLGPQRTTEDLNLNFAQQRAGEAGGIVSFVEISGVAIVGYVVDDIPNVKPLGIQLNDVEFMDLSRQYHPAKFRRVDKPGAAVGLARKGTYDTNFVHPDASPYCGKPAYLTVSGLITDVAGTNPRIGTFLSDLNDVNMPGLPRSSQYITIFGGGYSRDQVFTKTQDGWDISTQGDFPIQILSPGFVRIRIAI